MANALLAIDSAKISANMSNRLSEAIINGYKDTKGKPINFTTLIENYTDLQPQNERERMDSVKSVLSQLERANLFLNDDRIDLIGNSFIVKMDKFPKQLFIS